MMYSYFNKSLTDKALEEWSWVTPNNNDQMVENFKYFLEEWFITLLPNNTFVTQKEWMTNTMKAPYIMKVEDFSNRLKTLNHFLTLRPYDDKKDTVFTDTDLMVFLLKLLPSTWQNASVLKRTRNTDNFWQILSYFIQYQNITDTQRISKLFATPQNLEIRQQHKYICTNCK